MNSPPVRVLRGDDPVLLADSLASLLDELVGDLDRSLVVSEHAGEEYGLGVVADDARTPPFLTDRRVVVARGAGRFSTADDVAPLVAYLDDPSPWATVVLVWERGPGQPRLSAIPRSLQGALKAVGAEVTATDAPSGRERQRWVVEQVRGAGLRLEPAALELVAEQLGDGVSRLPAVLSVLTSTYGEGARLGADEVAPFLGEAGGVPPWELTDAIDRGDVAGALERLHRTLGAGERHALQVMATLQSHVGRLLRLDGAGVADERAAAELLGMKGSTFPAKKALERSRRMGSERIAEAVRLVARADLDLRGGTAWPPELVMEVLVARLARLSASAGRGRSAAHR